jgi:hypothetical protein
MSLESFLAQAAAGATHGPEFQQMLSKARDALRGGRDAWAAQSTGEKLAVALVLNRADWLEEMNYTIAEAIGRIGVDWASAVPDVARALRDTDELR